MEFSLHAFFCAQNREDTDTMPSCQELRSHNVQQLDAKMSQGIAARNINRAVSQPS